VLILSMSGDDEYIDQAISAGVSAYLVKDTVASELIAAIREVKKGNAFFSPSVSKILLEKQKNALFNAPRKTLTLREKQIIQFIADGKTSREIGEYLHISTRTVDKHRQQMMEKLGIHDVASLTRFALTKGLVK